MRSSHRSSRHSVARRVGVVAGTIALSLTPLAGCSDDPEPSGGNDPIAVTIDGGEVTPQGDRVPVTKEAPVTLEVTSDVAGELHVHAAEEQTFDFEAGSTDIELALDQPGIVDVELHDPDVLVLQLEVR